MSDEDRDIDVESDEDDTDLGLPGMAGDFDLDNPDITQFMTQSEKRAHHNALERRRRDHIKDSFHSLRDSVPTLQGEKVSRAQILKKASDYIQHMRRKNHCHQTDIDGLKKHNRILENQVRGLEKARATGHFAAATSALNPKGGMVSAFDGGSDSESSDLDIASERPVKKQKTYP